MTNKNEQVELAKLAEQAERYTDMTMAMKKAVEMNNQLTNEEHNLLSVAYKNVTGAYRTSWRAISTIEQKADGSECARQMAKEYQSRIEGELRNICQELLTLLDKCLLPKATTNELKIFYLKIKGDSYRYLAEITIDSERQRIAEEAQYAYQSCLEMAKNEMHVTNPIRLGVALNFSVFYYEILHEPDTAYSLAKQAFDDALPELDTLDGDAYRESTLVMQLLLDNYTL